MTPSSSPQRPNEQDRNTSTSEISVSEGSSITSRSESDIDTEMETISREPSVQPAGNVVEDVDKREENENDVELPVSTEPIIDYEIFGQILEMNEVDESGESDDEEENFVRGLVTNYYDQAVSTFKSMDDALQRKDLQSLSKLGHFLKGSSAALGIQRVRTSCEKIQHVGKSKTKLKYLTPGNGKDSSDRERDVYTDDEALNIIGKLIKRANKEFKEAQVSLNAELEKL